MSTIDVIITNFNYGRYLPEAIGSVQSQNVDYRILVVDNASTDDSVEVVRALQKGDPRIFLVPRPRNLGFFASIREGIDWATSEYQTHLCADDTLAPGALAGAIAALDAHPSSSMAVGRDYHYVEHASTIVAPPRTGAWSIVSSEAFLKDWARTPCKNWTPAGVIIRTTAQRRVGYWTESVRHSCDIEVALRLAAVGDVAVTTDVLSFIRRHGENRGAALANIPFRLDDIASAWRSFFELEGTRLPYGSELHKIFERGLAATAFWWSVRQLLRGDVASAKILLISAYKTRPASLVAPPVAFLLRELWRRVPARLS